MMDENVPLCLPIFSPCTGISGTGICGLFLAIFGVLILCGTTEVSLE